MGATTVGSLVFFAGGRTASPLGSPYTDEVSVYDSGANTWSTLQLSVPRGELGDAQEQPPDGAGLNQSRRTQQFSAWTLSSWRK